LFEPAIEALEKIKSYQYKHKEWVFADPSNNKYWENNKINKAWRQTLKKLKIRYRNPYQTRHTFASIMLSIGQPLGWLQVQMGHASLRMLEERYARWIPDVGDKRSDTVERLLSSMS
jgi:integrase